MKYDEIDEIKALAEIMQEYGLTAVKLKTDEDTEIALERASSPAPAAQCAPAPASLPDKEAEASEIKGGTAVKSPMVGVFYSGPSPEAEPFVKVGDRVKKGDVLCIIEAMKLMNEITAEQEGEIAEIRAEDGGLVEFGQTLFILK